MPDTKTGREKKGLNKRTQLTERLYEREVAVLDGEDDEPEVEELDGEFIAEELPDEN